MHKFSSSFRKAIEESVPIKKVDIKSPNQPIWFNKQAKKLVNKQRKLYSKFKSTSDPFHLESYSKVRRSNKKAFRTLKKKFVSEKVCKPLLKGNSKPFYKYLRSKRNEQHSITSLLLPNGSTTTCNHECAKLFNTYFHKKFCTDEQLVNTSLLPITFDIIDIDEKGISLPT